MTEFSFLALLSLELSTIFLQKHMHQHAFAAGLALKIEQRFGLQHTQKYCQPLFGALFHVQNLIYLT